MKKNKNKSAVALKYDDFEDDAPKVVAKGERKVAEKIIETAKEHKIPIYEDEALVNKLKTLEIDENIPRELYDAVAQVLVFISGLDREN